MSKPPAFRYLQPIRCWLLQKRSHAASPCGLAGYCLLWHHRQGQSCAFPGQTWGSLWVSILLRVSVPKNAVGTCMPSTISPILWLAPVVAHGPVPGCQCPPAVPWGSHALWMGTTSHAALMGRCDWDTKAASRTGGCLGCWAVLPPTVVLTWAHCSLSPVSSCTLSEGDNILHLGQPTCFSPKSAGAQYTTAQQMGCERMK